LHEWAKSGQQIRKNTGIDATAAATTTTSITAAATAPAGGICWSMTFKSDCDCGLALRARRKVQEKMLTLHFHPIGQSQN